MQKIDRFDGDFAFLSNFYASPLTIDGIRYGTVEHAFQAAKTSDDSLKRAIAAKPTPGGAKRAGGKRGIIGASFRADWEEAKVGVMEDLVRRKFTAYSELREKLLATGDAELVEGNTWNDTFWGVCRGKGQNVLGRILMKIRAELRGS